MKQFWQRTTNGLELNQLWNQFFLDTRTSYRLYSRGIDYTRRKGVKEGRHWQAVSKQLFWAILEKLSPARRVALLLALILLFVTPDLSWTAKEVSHHIRFDLRFWGGMLLFVLLMLEVADRVVMKRDLEIAREIQGWLLPPHPPPVPGVEIAFSTRPANTVAGDYYDVFPRPAAASANPNFLIAVADVAGKSIPAALLMATFQASLKTLSNTPSSLADLVAGMNLYACSNSQNGLRFITAFLAEYEPATRTLTYINAGHNYPLLRRRSGRIERLDVGGLPFGIRADAIYQMGTVTLDAGDWLVVFTDGVVEAVDEAGTEYGEARLISILNAGADTSPATMLGHTMADLDRFVGDTPQHDDITCLLIKATSGLDTTDHPVHTTALSRDDADTETSEVAPPIE
jgi:serine phosphatase RsbU (regulator of sigma subunit)